MDPIPPHALEAPPIPKPPEVPTVAPIAIEPQPTPVTDAIDSHPMPPATPRDVLQAVAAPAAKPNLERDKVNTVLQEASHLLLELKDARIVLTVLAHQATDTPLGREFRDRVLAMVQEIDTSKLPADQQQARQAFDALKQKMIEIRPLPQPEIKPQNTELFKFLQGQPSSEQTTFLIQAMENGAPTEQVIRAALERPEFKTVAAELQKTLFPNGIPQIAEQLLQAAGIDGTKENLKTMEGILHPKDKLTLKKLGNYLFIALVIMMLSSRMLTPMIQESEGQSSGGH